MTLKRYAKLFDLGDVGRRVGYPLFMKPYDGGAWVGVTKIDDEAALRAAYEASGKRLMHVQKAVAPFDIFVRGLGVGPQVNIFRYDASAPLHARYTTDHDFVSKDEASVVRDMTLTINTFFGWDFNSCEALRKDGVFQPIDFANACPDSQVTSLHYHLPWLVKAQGALVALLRRDEAEDAKDARLGALLRDRGEGDALPREAPAYAAIARKRLDTDRFEEFCAKQLKHLDEVAWEFYATDTAKNAVRSKVAALFPAHEVDEFTEYFWAKIHGSARQCGACTVSGRGLTVRSRGFLARSATRGRFTVLNRRVRVCACPSSQPSDRRHRTRKRFRFRVGARRAPIIATVILRRGHARRAPTRIRRSRRTWNPARALIANVECHRCTRKRSGSA